MEKNYHLISTGELKRKDNTLVFKRSNGEKEYIPIEDVECLFAHNPIDINTKTFQLLDKHTVELHIFTWNDKYSGCYLPTKDTKSGAVVVEQVESYKNSQKRQAIATSFVESSIHNMEKTLKYYNSEYELRKILTKLDNLKLELSSQYEIEDIMGLEGSARTAYYSGLEKIIPEGFDFETRNYNPPTSNFNALVSFGNSLLYASMTSAIQSTSLDPKISYLHEPANRRNSLSLDLADIFKPVIVDRTLLRLVNRRQIQPRDFKETEDWLLTEEGRKKVLKEYEETLDETIEHPKLNRNVSYQYLLRLEALSLKKHILTGEEYTGFKRWW
jgi:CRISPR-associated protein Cas1